MTEETLRELMSLLEKQTHQMQARLTLYVERLAGTRVLAQQLDQRLARLERILDRVVVAQGNTLPGELARAATAAADHSASDRPPTPADPPETTPNPPEPDRP